jgi:hypothetical protein
MCGERLGESCGKYNIPFIIKASESLGVNK